MSPSQDTPVNETVKAAQPVQAAAPVPPAYDATQKQKAEAKTRLIPIKVVPV